MAAMSPWSECFKLNEDFCHGTKMAMERVFRAR